MTLTETTRLADDEPIHRMMRQWWERWQEDERTKVEREASALEAFGFPPEKFFPEEWPGSSVPTFADMLREWEAPIHARVERKQALMAEVFAELAEHLGEVTAIGWGIPSLVRPDGPVYVAGYEPAPEELTS